MLWYRIAIGWSINSISYGNVCLDSGAGGTGRSIGGRTPRKRTATTVHTEGRRAAADSEEEEQAGLLR